MLIDIHIFIAVPTRASYYFRFELEYDTGTAAGTAQCITYYETLIRSQLEAADGVAANLANECQNEILQTQSSTFSIVVTPSTTTQDLSFVFESNPPKVLTSDFFEQKN